MGTDMLSRFPHQFEPFVALPFGFSARSRSRYDNTIIRLPLRAASSSLARVLAGSCCPALCTPSAVGLRGVTPTPVEPDAASPSM